MLCWNHDEGYPICGKCNGERLEFIGSSIYKCESCGDEYDLEPPQRRMSNEKYLMQDHGRGY